MLCSELKPKHLVCLGGFKNLRQDYNYEGLKMELDETTYEWGTCYEIEIETVSIDIMHAKLQDTVLAHCMQIQLCKISTARYVWARQQNYRC